MLAVREGLWLYQRPAVAGSGNRAEDRLVWRRTEARSGSSFIGAYACTPFIAPGAMSEVPGASRYARYVCVASGDEEAGHSVCVTSTASTFEYHHELHGRHRVLCTAISPTSLTGPTVFYQNPLVMSVDASGAVAVFDVERHGAQWLMVPCSTTTASADQVPLPYQLREGEVAVAVQLHGECSSNTCSTCHHPSSSSSPREGGSCLTAHILTRAPEGQERLLQLRILWTPQRCVLLSETVLHAAPLTLEQKLVGEGLRQRSAAGLLLSLISSQTGGYVLQLSEASGSEGVMFFEGCSGALLGRSQASSSPSSGTGGPVRLLPLGHRDVREQGRCQVSVGITADGSLQLLSLVQPSLSEGIEKERQVERCLDSAVEISRWLDEDEGDDATHEKRVQTASATDAHHLSTDQQLPPVLPLSTVSGPTYVVLEELISYSSFVCAKNCFGARQGGSDHQQQLRTVALLSAPAQSFLLCTSYFEFFELPSRVLQAPLPPPPLSSSSSKANSGTLQPTTGGSWGMSRFLASAVLSLATATASRSSTHTDPSKKTASSAPLTRTPGIPSAASEAVEGGNVIPRQRIVDALDTELPAGDQVTQQQQEAEAAFPDPPAEDHERVPNEAVVRSCYLLWELACVLEPAQREALEWMREEDIQALLCARSVEYQTLQQQLLQRERRAGSEKRRSNRREECHPQLHSSGFFMDCERRRQRQDGSVEARRQREEEEAQLRECLQASLSLCQDGTAPPARLPPPFLQQLQEQDRFDYEVRDLMYRHTEELKVLKVCDVVELVEVQKRVVPASPVKGGEGPFHASLWEETPPALSDRFFFCRRSGKQYRDLKHWTTHADAVKRNTWQWESEVGQGEALGTAAPQQQQSKPTLGKRSTVSGTLRGWRLHDWSYGPQWPPLEEAGGGSDGAAEEEEIPRMKSASPTTLPLNAGGEEDTALRMRKKKEDAAAAVVRWRCISRSRVHLQNAGLMAKRKEKQAEELRLLRERVLHTS